MKHLALIALGATLLGCSFSFSTQSSGSDDEQQRKLAERIAQAREERVRSAQHAERDQAANEEQRREAAEAEQAKQDACRDELSRVAPEVLDPRLAALRACPKTSIPPGTYKGSVEASGAPVAVELEVTSEGCAAYEASRVWTSNFTRRFRDKHGTFEREYTDTLMCVVGGTIGADLRAKHKRFEGDCVRKYTDAIDETVAAAVTKGAAPAVTLTTSADGAKVRLTRASSEVTLLPDGQPRLWAKQEQESTQQARASIAFAKPKPGQGVNMDALYAVPGSGAAPAAPASPPARDWCAELAGAKAAADESEAGRFEAAFQADQQARTPAQRPENAAAPADPHPNAADRRKFAERVDEHVLEQGRNGDEAFTAGDGDVVLVLESWSCSRQELHKLVKRKRKLLREMGFKQVDCQNAAGGHWWELVDP